jgi:hypothetical protein
VQGFGSTLGRVNYPSLILGLLLAQSQNRLIKILTKYMSFDRGSYSGLLVTAAATCHTPA